jgi:hypothetical protein
MIGNRAVASNPTCICSTYLGGELQESSRETTEVEEEKRGETKEIW